jgi:hypothetical protein
MGRRPPLQTPYPQFPVLPGENLIFISSRHVRNVLQISDIHTSYHAGWSGPGRTRLPCAVQSICARHAHALPPRRVSDVSGWHGYTSPVPQSTASLQVSRDLSQQTRALATGLEDCYQPLNEHRSALYKYHEMCPKTQATPAFRRANTMG